MKWFSLMPYQRRASILEVIEDHMVEGFTFKPRQILK